MKEEVKKAPEVKAAEDNTNEAKVAEDKAAEVKAIEYTPVQKLPPVERDDKKPRNLAKELYTVLLKKMDSKDKETTISITDKKLESADFDVKQIDRYVRYISEATNLLVKVDVEEGKSGNTFHFHCTPKKLPQPTIKPNKDEDDAPGKQKNKEKESGGKQKKGADKDKA